MAIVILIVVVVVVVVSLDILVDGICICTVIGNWACICILFLLNYLVLRGMRFERTCIIRACVCGIILFHVTC